jgi:uroporphyrinogen decarboxylase
MNASSPVTKPFLATLAGKKPEHPPIWLMRQAGRYLPEYRALRKQAASFLDFCFTPGLAIEATLQPIRRYGLDAAILFSDILTIPWALGQGIAFLEGEGPKLSPIRSSADLSRLKQDGVTERLEPVYSAVVGVKAALPRETSLIGFAGAPWTVAAYMVEGGGSRDFAEAKLWALTNPALFDSLLDIVVVATIDHLSSQIVAGAETVQLFDSWSGALAEPEFRRWVIAPTRRITAALKQRHPSVPVIGFPRGSGGLLIAYANEAGVDAVGLDTQVPLAWATASLPPGLPVQGNLDPVVLIAGGQKLADEVHRIRETVSDRPLIFNLGHGVVLTTPPEHVAELVRLVRS